LSSNILSVNRNNSQLSENRVENNSNSSSNNNIQANNNEATNNNTFMEKKGIKHMNTPTNGLTTLFNNNSPKINYSNKIKSLVDNFGGTGGKNKFN
jgi:hypothetical protein